MTAASHILATCMGFNRARDPWQPSPVFRYAFELAGNLTKPKVCFIPTASDDDTASIESFYAAFADTDVETSHLALSADDRPRDLARFLGEKTLVWVDRGNVAKALEVWREHGLDQVLRDCYEHGVILGGESAGSLCWFAGGVTDSFGEVQAHRDGLGLLPYSNAVHYGDRRQVFEGAMRAGELPSEGYAMDTGAGLHFQGHELVRAISDRKHAGAYRVTANGSDVHEEPLDVTRLKRS